MFTKVGVVTITDNNNYGNRLQNYAVQEIVRKIDIYVETIRTRHPISKEMNNNFGSKIHIIFNNGLFVAFKKVYCKFLEIVKYIIYKNIMAKRISSFEKFSQYKIIGTDYLISDRNIPIDINDKYDYVLLGGDQIWNPTFRFGSGIDFGSFVPPEKRVAFAPSFGIDKIPDEYIDIYKKYLSEIKSLSIREESGVKIIKELTGRDATLLVDPTMVLDRDQWISIARAASHKPSRNYLLTYFLGPVSKETERVISRIASNNKLLIVRMADLRQKKYYTADPSEFLDFINSSSIVLTDSYHGTIFAILFEKPFVVFDRQSKEPSMGTRIDTLLSKFHLENRKWGSLKDSSDLFNIDYTHIPAILEYERQKAYDYLKTALNIKE